MSTVSAFRDASARKPDANPSKSAIFEHLSHRNEASMLQALLRVKGRVVAEEVGVSEATVSRLKEGELAFWAKVLASLGLKCVPLSEQTFDEGEVQALLVLARKCLDVTTSAQDLMKFCRRFE